MTHIAITAAFIACLTKIVQQYASPTYLRLCILLHTLQFVEVDFLLSALIRKLPQGDNVLQVVEQNRLARQTVAPTT